MKQTLYPLLFSCLLCTLGLTGHSQNTFIHGHLTGTTDGQFIYVTSYPAPFGPEQISRDSAKIKKGSFNLKMSIPVGEGGLYYISSVPLIYDKGEPANFFKDMHRRQLLYLEKGKFTVDGDAGHLDTATYAGDSLMIEENDYFKHQRRNLAWQRTVKRTEDAYHRGEDINKSVAVKQDSVGNDVMFGVYNRKAIARNWVLHHLSSPYSMVLIQREMSNFFDANLEEKDSLFHLLTPQARDNRIGKTFAKIWDHAKTSP